MSDSVAPNPVATVSQGTTGLWTDPARPSTETLWLWDGFLAEGNITLLTAQSKSGKTTLLTHVLARMRLAGTLAERAVAPVKAVVITEEPRHLWEARHERFNLENVFFINNLYGTPGVESWHKLLEH